MDKDHLPHNWEAPVGIITQSRQVIGAPKYVNQVCKLLVAEGWKYYGGREVVGSLELQWMLRIKAVEDGSES